MMMMSRDLWPYRSLPQSQNEGSWSHLGWIDECLGLGLGIEGLDLGISLGQLDLSHIPAVNTSKK